jgi:choline dehydrogenase-like flavoprotein
VSLDDPITDFVSSSLSKSLVEVMELQFAAGSQFVVPLHIAGKPLRNLAEAKAWAAATPMGTMQLLVGCAHVMGGCAMGGDAARSMVDDWGRHRAIENLTVIDGSVFPTSVGANPQESIYATAAKNAGALAKSLKA